MGNSKSEKLVSLNEIYKALGLDHKVGEEGEKLINIDSAIEFLREFDADLKLGGLK